MDLKPGLVGEVEIVVTEDVTAAAWGNKGVDVLATPELVGLLEGAATNALLPHLPPGAGTVGTLINMKHLAATPVGMRVRVKATLREVDGRRFVFDLEAWDDEEKVAEGTHERFQVSMDKFFQRIAQKGKQGGGRG